MARTICHWESRFTVDSEASAARDGLLAIFLLDYFGGKEAKVRPQKSR